MVQAAGVGATGRTEDLLLTGGKADVDITFMSERTGMIVGIDEAGYGPLLGPYVLSSAFFSYRGEEPLEEVSPAFWPSLFPAVDTRPRRDRIAVADSKLLYRGKSGLKHLEEGVLAFMASEGPAPSTLRDLLSAVGEDPGTLDRYPWYRKRDLPLPRATFVPLVKSLSARLREAFRSCPFTFRRFRSRVLEAGAFNECLNRTGNKASVGLSVIGEILKRLFGLSRGREVVVLVDRQGGRTHYARYLWSVLEPKGIFVDREGEEESSYRVTGKEGEKLAVKFLRGGEGEALPVALASMSAKYIRELHMELLNGYFSDRLGPGLRPTAGYVKDARRFLAEIGAFLEKADFPPELLIRQR